MKHIQIFFIGISSKMKMSKMSKMKTHQFIMKLMNQINNSNSYAIDKLMHQSHATHLNDILNCQVI